MPWLLAIAAAALSLAAEAEVFELPENGDTVVGSLSTVKARHWDTLLDIARRHGLGYYDIVRANPGVDPWLPGEGTEVVLPSRFILPDVPRQGIVLNLPEYRMYYFPPAEDGRVRSVMTFPISIGRMDWATPIGMTRVTTKVRDPSWYPPESVRQEHLADGDPLPHVVPPGPANPLGRFAMRLAIPGYLIHGTNKPAGVGMRVTHGCIRMFPEDIEFLFDHIAVNTPVHIIDEPYKFGWHDGRLLMEAHLPLESAPPPSDEPVRETGTGTAAEAATESAEELGDAANADEGGVVSPSPLTRLTELYVAATGDRDATVDWDAVEAVQRAADGIPRYVDRPARSGGLLVADKKTPRRARR